MKKTAAMALVLLGTASCLNARVFRQLAPEPIPAKQPSAGLDSLSAASCGACHGEVYAEWASSSLATSWTDPAFQAAYEHAGQPYDCASCHSPLENQIPAIARGLTSVRPELVARTRPNPDFDAELQAEGVTCVVCHQHGSVQHGPSPAVDAPHVVVHNPLMGQGANSCQHCHQAQEDPLGRLHRPRYDTVIEWFAWGAITGREASCADCHMPIAIRTGPDGAVKTGRQHSFVGAWDDETVRSGLTLRAPEPVSRGISVRLANKAGHRFPSGSTARALQVTAIALSPDGTELVRKSEWIERRLDADGTELSDNTLLPGEVRELRFRFAPDEVSRASRIRVSAVYHRLRGLPHAAGAASRPQDLTVQITSREIAWPPSVPVF